jgi:hypothetical protein
MHRDRNRTPGSGDQTTQYMAQLAFFMIGDMDFEISVDLGMHGNRQDQHVTSKSPAT